MDYLLIQTQQLSSRFRIESIFMNSDIVKVYFGVENTSEKITYNHYTEIIFLERWNGLGGEYTSTLEC